MIKKENKSNHTEKTSGIWLPAALIVFIMLISVGFRLLCARTSKEILPDGYYDPETGLSFLTEMDSYYHLRMTRDIMEYGHPGESVENGENWDTLSYAPKGRSAGAYSPLMAYIASGTARIAGAAFGIPLEKVIYYLGTFLSALVVIPVFILTKHLSDAFSEDALPGSDAAAPESGRKKKVSGLIAASAAAVLSAINYGYFVHTVPGFYDTDMVIPFTGAFFLTFASLFTEVLLSKAPKKGTEDGNRAFSRILRKRILYGILTFISLFLLILSWDVYGLFVGIFALSLILFAALSVIPSVRKKNAPGRMIFFAAGLLFALLICILIADRSFFGRILSQAKDVFAGGTKSLFPDAYVSVSEMRKPAFTAGGLTGLFQMKVLSDTDIGILNAVGGIVPALSSLAVFVLLILKMRKGQRSFPAFLVMVWFLITLVLAVRGWRFMMLFAVPVAILCGMAAGKVVYLMRKGKMMDYPVYAAMILLLALFPALYGAYRSSGDSLPAVSRPVYDAALAIREKTDENTIIASWWDFGYFYEEKAGRRTLFDGGSQNGQRVYFVGKALATEDETLSRNILRMLAGSGDEAAEGMISAFGEKKETLAFMDELLKTDKEAAYRMLSEKRIGEEKAKELSELLFPGTKDPLILILTPDMPKISGWFATFGYYGEEEGDEMSDRFRILLDAKDYNPEDEKAGWAFGSEKGECRFLIEKKGEGYAAYTELAGKGASGEDKQNSQPYPVERVIIRSAEGIRSFRSETETDSKKKGYTAYVTIDEAGSSVTLMTSALMDSIFGRLFYLEGEGVSLFSQAGNNGSGTLLYRVN